MQSDNATEPRVYRGVERLGDLPRELHHVPDLPGPETAVLGR